MTLSSSGHRLDQPLLRAYAPADRRRYKNNPRRENVDACAELARLRKGPKTRRNELAVRAAVAAIVKQNQGIVALVARRQVRRCKSLELQDLMQQGNIGLLEAIERFDHTRGIAFITYAIWWVRAAISRHIFLDDDVVKRPEGMSKKKKRLQRLAFSFVSREGRYPDAEELSAMSKTDKFGTLSVLQCENAWSMTLDYTKSLDEPASRDSNDTYLDRLSSPEIDPNEPMDTEKRVRAVEKLLRKLTPREQAVIKARYWDEKSLEEAGRDYLGGVTRERARQIEVVAMQKLAKSARQSSKVREML